MNPKTQMEKALMELFKDPQPVHLQISKLLAWQLCSVIQLACRHPNFTGPTRQSTESLVRELFQVLCANNNDLRQLAEMGWHKQFDEEPCSHLPGFTQDEILFLLWCVGFAEGRARQENKYGASFIRNCDATRVKLMSLSPVSL